MTQEETFKRWKECDDGIITGIKDTRTHEEKMKDREWAEEFMKTTFGLDVSKLKKSVRPL
ncbi:hypothetical protein [Methanospirillum hungatei]|uniref:hypothetical protein n=1 Tax=Methanospirillum hungatei TaxID=2203 RepID=UPI0003213097|nr:hypothetical protein [Methanospirillum hungatei]